MSEPQVLSNMLAGGGVSGELIRSIDWSKTPIGPISHWPRSLITTVETMLHSRHPMFLWWGPSLIQFYNDAYLPSFGVGKHPAAMSQAGRDCWSEIWPIIGPQIEGVMADGTPTWHEDALVPIYRNDRIEEVYWTYGYSPVFDDDRRVGGTLVICTETTARVLAARREQLFAAIVDRGAQQDHTLASLLHRATASPQDVPFAVVFDAAGAPTFASRALDDHEVADLARGANAARQAAIEVDLVTAMKSRPWPEPVTRVFAVPLRDGNVAVFGLSPRLPFDASYRDFLLRIVDCIGIAHDRADAAADRERAAALAGTLSLTTQRLHAAQRAAQVGIFEWDVVADQVSWSAELYALMGLEPGAIAASRAASIAAVIEEDREQSWRAYREATKLRARLLELEVRLRQPGGGACWVRISTELEYDGAGAITRAFGAVVGIQNLKEAAEERARALAEAERISRAKDEFLATMSHELRTPLNAILGWATMLRSLTGDTEKLARGLAVIERNAEAQARLISDLLDVSRIISGKLRLVVQRVDVVTAVHAAIDVVRQAADAKGVRLVAELAPDTGALVADPDRLQQIVWNLLSNAVKFTPSGGTVRITAQRIAARVRVCVADTGAGLAREHLAMIFERFHQIDGSITRTHGGLGLGLAIVRHLAEAHGGTVTAHSDGPGTGAAFTVEMPVHAIHTSDTQELHRIAGLDRRDAATANGNRLRGVRVLAVDDEDDSLELLRVVLEMAGATVIGAKSAPAALSEIVRARFDVVISDIGMPNVDGYGFMRQLRGHDVGGDIPAIALTAYARAEDAAHAFRAGYQEHVTKPVDAGGLIATVARMVRR